jgi:branched-chain amino acid transport system ATP-binding protein
MLPPAHPLIEAVNLSSGWSSVPVLHQINMKVGPGEVVALLGPNGAGKTTTILTLAGLLEQTEGDVLVGGSVTRKPFHARVNQGIGLVTEERSVFMGLSVRDNLRLGRGSVERALDFFPELRSILGRRAGLCSGGEQQMVTLSRCLAGEPKLIMVDELSLGLAPLIVERLLRAIRDAADRGVGVLMVEQHVTQAFKIADRAYVMRRGRITIEGPISEIRGNVDSLQKTYLQG